jgi:hypothetical protein
MRTNSPRRGRRVAPAPAAPISLTARVDRALPTVVAGAKLLWVEAGLHSLVVAPARVATRRAAGMSFPAILVSVPDGAEPDAVELMGAAGSSRWIGAEGGSLVLRAQAHGGSVLVTGYTLPDQTASALDLELRAFDGTWNVAPTGAAAPDLVRAEIVLHIEREGDRQFAAGGWAGRIGSHLRVEALAVRPLEAISRGEIEYKVFSHGGRETPWVGDGRLCGTRGQGTPLTGFAVRLAPHLRDGFDVVYRGAFFASGPGPLARNGEPCVAALPDDTLEAVEIRIFERGAD